MWTVFVLSGLSSIEWSKSTNGEVVTTYKSFIWFINNKLHNYINPIFVQYMYVSINYYIYPNGLSVKLYPSVLYTCL